MTVTCTVALPGQPDQTGQTHLEPLGGDGFTAPHSAYIVYAACDGDVSSGENRIYIQPDARYVSLVQYVAISISGASADKNVRMTITSRSQDALHVVRVIPYYAAVSGAGKTNNAGIWSPPPLLIANPGAAAATNPPYLLLMTPNVNGETVALRTRIYNFDVRAREVTPLDDLLASVPRPGSFT